MKTLVTGFKPFLGASANPSEILAGLLSQNSEGIDSLILPVEFKNSFEILKDHLQSNAYENLILLGLASGRKNICFEKIALNWVQTEHQDEAKSKPPTGKIISSEPLAVMSLFPIDEIYSKLKSENHLVEISFSAGTYVCNDLYFRCLTGISIKTVFVHLPLIVEMDLETQKSILLRSLELVDSRGRD